MDLFLKNHFRSSTCSKFNDYNILIDRYLFMIEQIKKSHNTTVSSFINSIVVDQTEKKATKKLISFQPLSWFYSQTHRRKKTFDSRSKPVQFVDHIVWWSWIIIIMRNAYKTFNKWLIKISWSFLNYKLMSSFHFIFCSFHLLFSSYPHTSSKLQNLEIKYILTIIVEHRIDFFFFFLSFIYAMPLWFHTLQSVMRIDRRNDSFNAL